MLNADTGILPRHSVEYPLRRPDSITTVTPAQTHIAANADISLGNTPPP